VAADPSPRHAGGVHRLPATSPRSAADLI
jgi:hypothetical protein